MYKIWNHDGLTVLLTGVTVPNTDPCFEGTARNYKVSNSQMVTWCAYPTSHGFGIEVRKEDGRRADYQGPTFNLGLEVAMAVKASGF